MARKPDTDAHTDLPIPLPTQASAIALSPLTPSRDVKHVNGLTVHVKRRVSVPTLEFRTDGETVICRFIEAMVHHPMTIKDETTGEVRPKLDEKGQPAFLWVCKIESVRGEVRQLVLGELVMSELTTNYPGGGYIDLWFMIVRLGKRAGKRYVTYEISEIDDPRGHDNDGVIDGEIVPEAA